LSKKQNAIDAYGRTNLVAGYVKTQKINYIKITARIVTMVQS